MLQDEDMTAYKEMFVDLLTDTNLKILKIINKNLVVFMENWINSFEKKEDKTSPVSDGNIQKENKDFSSKIEEKPLR